MLGFFQIRLAPYLCRTFLLYFVVRENLRAKTNGATLQKKSITSWEDMALVEPDRVAARRRPKGRLARDRRCQRAFVICIPAIPAASRLKAKPGRQRRLART